MNDIDKNKKTLEDLKSLTEKKPLKIKNIIISISIGISAAFLLNMIWL